MTTRCAVLGSPIEHSLSPDLHRAAYAALGLTDWEYQRHRVEAGDLRGFIEALDLSWRGLSLTMPLKEPALELGAPDELSLLAGAANTMIIDHSGVTSRRRLYNTDVGGLIDAFRAVGVIAIESATILGSGATARSAMISVARMGARHVHLVARRVTHARQALTPTANALGLELRIWGWPGQPDPDAEAQGTESASGVDITRTQVPAGDVVVSTAVAGAADPIAAAVTRAAPVIFDVVYDPWPTELARIAHREGRTVINGLDLLGHQAVAQVELMTGRKVSAEILLQAGRAKLNKA